MLTALYKYLIFNEIVAIPGVGNFTISTIPASVNSSIINPPQQVLSFQAGTTLTDKKFYNFLAEESRVSEVDAIRKFQDFAYQLRKDIQANKHVELTGLGIFSKSVTNDLSFQSTFSLDKFFTSISLQQVAVPATIINTINRAEEHGIEVYPEDESNIPKDRWWIWALVLALIALVAIAYSFMQEGAI